MQDTIVLCNILFFLILAPADSTQLASVGIGVGIAVVMVSIAIVTTVVVIVLLVIKLRSKPTGKLFNWNALLRLSNCKFISIPLAQLIFSNKDVNQLDIKSQAIHKVSLWALL